MKVVRSQLPLGLRLRDSSVFGSFFAGRNQPIVDALQALAPGTLPPVVFLHGVGVIGKSHLLQATCVAAPSKGLSAAYLPLLDVGHMGPEVLAGWGELDVVCLDDIDHVAASREWNLALFALHQQLEERRAKLVIASRLAPASLKLRLPDLESRLLGGLVFTLHALDELEQTRALQLRAKLRGFDLPEDTASYLLRRLPRDMATLCKFLDELDEASLIAQRRLTIPFVREVMDR